MTEELKGDEPVEPVRTGTAEGADKPLEPSEAPRPKAFKIERKREMKKPALLRRFAGRWPDSMRADVFCLLAALLGLMSLGLPWVHDPSAAYDEEYTTLWHFLIDEPSMDTLVFGLATVGVLLGSVMALFSRLGGLVQMAGVVSFLTISIPSGGSYAYGFYFGLTACVLGVASLVMRRTLPIPGRFLTVWRIPGGEGWSLNVLSILGGALGMLSTVLVWFRIDQSLSYWGPAYSQELSLLEFGGFLYSSQLLTLALVLFVAGSLVSILTPLGFIGQLTGISSFVYALRGEAAHVEFHYPYYVGSGTTSYELGLYLAMVCTLLVFLSVLVSWRLRLSERMVSFFLSWPSRDAAGTQSTEPTRPAPLQWTGLTPVLIHSIRYAAVAIVILSIAVAAAGLSYVMPWSTLEVSVANSDMDSRLHAVIYIDGEGTVAEYISSETHFTKTFSVRAGTHRVGVDYGFPDDSQATDIDGAVDWANSVEVSPLRKSVMSVEFGLTYHERPVIALSVSEHDNGWRFDVTSVNDDNPYWGTLSWNDVRVMLHDGIGTLSWNAESSALDNGTFCEQAFPAQALGDVTVMFAITDLMGDGYVGIGDYLTVTSGTDNLFGSSTTYTLYVMYEPSGSLSVALEVQGRY